MEAMKRQVLRLRPVPEGAYPLIARSTGASNK
jgi:hypothetical protein